MRSFKINNTQYVATLDAIEMLYHHTFGTEMTTREANEQLFAAMCRDGRCASMSYIMVSHDPATGSTPMVVFGDDLRWLLQCVADQLHAAPPVVARTMREIRAHLSTGTAESPPRPRPTNNKTIQAWQLDLYKSWQEAEQARIDRLETTAEWLGDREPDDRVDVRAILRARRIGHARGPLSTPFRVFQRRLG